MRKEDLFENINEIDEKYIKIADTYNPKKKSTIWIKCMSVDYSTVRDFHKIERMIEIITRSPHNRVLLRCNQFQSVLLGWSNDLSNALSSFVSFI